MRIIVTGSAGHLGEALARVLGSFKHEIVGVDLRRSKYTSAVGDIREREFAKACVANAHAVLHTAALHKPHVCRNSHAPAVRRDEHHRNAEPAQGIQRGRRADIRLYQHHERLRLRVAIGVRSAGRVDHGRRRTRSRRADIEDVVDAHLASLERSERIGRGRYIVSATTPFDPSDCDELGRDAPAVLQRVCPYHAAEYARRGWPRSARCATSRDAAMNSRSEKVLLEEISGGKAWACRAW
jgi:nucleoside-diphosphate-sugar epimerase